MEQSWTVIIQHLNLESAKSVIEIGTGRGKSSNAIVSRLPVLKSYKNVKVQQANALNLQKFEAGSFERYRVLPLVPNQVEMLRQARRVLKDGEHASFSVWGNKANNSMFSLRPSGVSKSISILMKI